MFKDHSAAVLPAIERYRPISVLAIIGSSLGLLSFAVWFFYLSGWIVWLFAVFALVISVMALRRIRRSDGTLAGWWLANLGVLFSLVNLIAYPVMYLTTGYLLHRESEAVVDHWLSALARKDAAAAYIDTMPNRKEAYRPSELEPNSLRVATPTAQGNRYDSFRAIPIVASLLRYGQQCSWRRLGITGIEQFEGSFIIKHRYRIETPEMKNEVVITTMSTEETSADNRTRRLWYVRDVETMEKDPRKPLTEYGKRVNGRYQELQMVLELRFTKHFLEGNKSEALTVTTFPTDHPGFEQLYNAIRDNSPEHTDIIVNRPFIPYLLVADSENNGKWILKVESRFRTEKKEFSAEITFQRQDDKEMLGEQDHLNKWRITDCRLIFERKASDIPTK